MACISKESALLISTRLKRLIYAISRNRFYDKALPKLPYLPNVFVFFINVSQFVITGKGIYLFIYLFIYLCIFLMPVSLSQYKVTVGMFRNNFANKRCNKIASATAEKCNRVNLV